MSKYKHENENQTIEETQGEEFDEQEIERAVAKNNLLNMASQLASKGVAEVRVTYDGYADSGVIGDTFFFDSDGQVREIADSSELYTTIEKAACSLLPLGWELDEGSLGELVLKTKEAKLVLEHAWRVTIMDEEVIEL